MSQPSPRSLTAQLENFSLSDASKKAPADSWEDEADEASTTTPPRPTSSSYPKPPPPTPASPSKALSPALSPKSTAAGSPYQSFPPFESNGSLLSTNTSSPDRTPSRSGDERRPEKSTAVAARLIAAGIGQKVPRRTKEEREYDQAMRLQERKKRDQAKEEEERRKKEAEKAKQAMWDD